MPPLIILWLVAVSFTYTQVSAAVFTWNNALRYIDFARTTSAPYTQYSPADFATPPNVWLSLDPDLGAYGSHVWKPGQLEYTLDVTGISSDFVDVKLGFAEVYNPLCNSVGRIMDVSVNEKKVSNLNVFALVGCKKPHDVIFERVDASVPIKVIVAGVVENPMIANIVVRSINAPTAPSTPATPSGKVPIGTSISRKYGAYNKIVAIKTFAKNRFSQIPGTSTFRDRNALIEGTVRPDVLLGHRRGSNFTYHIRGRGLYQIQLAFAETDPRYCEDGEDRIFSVFLNGESIPELTNVNVFEKEGCRHAIIYTHPGFRFIRNLFITFTGISGEAMVSHINVRRLPGACVPESTADASTADHLAHSVPGEYPPLRNARSPRSFVDTDSSGFSLVAINGDRSHTHFFDNVNDITGRITSYEWTCPDTGEFISNKVSFGLKFRLGTTKLALRVQDNICTTHSSETSVTVTRSVTSGSYCYFYIGLKELPPGFGPDQETKPNFAKSYPDTNWNFDELAFASGDFAARCEFFVEIDPDALGIRGFLTTSGSGVASLYRGADVIVDEKKSANFATPLVAALSSFEVVYLHRASEPTAHAHLSVRDSLNPAFSYDRSTVFPVIAGLAPTSAPISGGTEASVTVLGAPLNAKEIIVGDKTVLVNRVNSGTRKIFFDIPSTETDGPVSISVKWDQGFVSNGLSFTYNTGPPTDRISFAEEPLRSAPNGDVFKGAGMSSIRIGNDGRIYCGTLSGKVLRITYDPDSLTVSEKCESERFVDPEFSHNGTAAVREILGMVLDPRDEVPHPYVSVQTLFWLGRRRIDADNPAGWRNGVIERLKPGTVTGSPSICLVPDKRILSGLPVSNHDHGVNGLEFTSTGDLLVAIGGNTNTGLPGRRLGALFETPLSGSITLAKLSKGAAFDGNIRYSNDTHPHKGVVLSGDIEIIATGIRNGFFPSLHSSGRLYITDNGPNVGFGDVISSCSDFDQNITYPTLPPSDYPGTVELGPTLSKSIRRPDKLLNIKLDGVARFYGHPNPPRSQCTYVDPLTNKGPNGEPAPSNYEPALLTVSSSANAVVEYHAANVFNGALRGNLIMSTYNNRPTYYVPPITTPEEATPVILTPRGGLSLAVNAWGDIIIPRLGKGDFLVLRPIVPNLDAREDVSITAVTPFRHGLSGGTTATIGGYNFGPGVASVTIGTKSCPVLSQSEKTITCRVPAGNTGGLETVAVTVEGQGPAILNNGLWYMDV